ncbi:hypothetical protein LTR56_010478 [Elasticomyces elasticus]|nr:hypothetical protein LTR56_010478 [Elasticomyces elasticus]KAK3657894.1 hypothetical protein LTR22_009121 [Elasticomyces elasticus]KAK4917580.1 hypothetical protein LTR49_014534 [Elasticomyces elasticus]KAK5762800.1 hypothetical protein LTS12_006989 [Elasticomyces elasticus]
MAARKRKPQTDGENGLPASHNHNIKDASRKKKRPLGAVSTRGSRITRAMKVDGTLQAVFNTAELLESILLHLSAKQVFGIQRVCKQFRDIVATSILLQQKLFLRTSRVDSGNMLAVKYGELVTLPTKIICPKLAMADSIARPNTLHLARPATHWNGMTELTTIGGRRAVDRLTGYGEILTLEPHRHEIKRGMAVTGDGSWKSMYPADHPCQRARVYVHWSIDTKPRTYGCMRCSEAITEDPRGFTLGGLVAKAVTDVLLCMDVEEDAPFSYEVGNEQRQHVGSGMSLIRKLEAESGKRAVIGKLRFAMEDVVFLDEKETSQIKVLPCLGRHHAQQGQGTVLEGVEC